MDPCGRNRTGNVLINTPNGSKLGSGESHVRRLARHGKKLGPRITKRISIVTCSTFRRWVRNEEGYVKPARWGRPRLAAVVRELAVLIAKETGRGTPSSLAN